MEGEGKGEEGEGEVWEAIHFCVCFINVNLESSHAVAKNCNSHDHKM